MNIQIGAHIYRNTDGTIEIEGVPQLEISLRKPGGPLRINFAIFDSVGKMPAKIINNALAVNEARAYGITQHSDSFLVTQIETGEEVLKVDVNGEDFITISKGQFYTLKGHLMKITPREWSVDKTTVKSGETDLQGKAVSLG